MERFIFYFKHSFFTILLKWADILFDITLIQQLTSTCASDIIVFLYIVIDIIKRGYLIYVVIIVSHIILNYLIISGLFLIAKFL